MIDRILVDYLSSGKAWVLVGTGPSIEMAYPSWSTLADQTSKWLAQEVHGVDLRGVQRALKNKDWALVFEEVCRSVNESRLLEFLRGELRSSGTGQVYDLICRWPVPVFLTTNWDDEIQKSLTRLREAYVPYGNSPDHMALLSQDFRGGIVKLHGDLRSSQGLVLRTSQYNAIQSDPTWEYWRVKMTGIFGMNKVVVIGHSLQDPHMRHVLQAAKVGSGVNQPVCWIAPDVSLDDCRMYLHDFRIRVISYDNRDGTHRNLTRLLHDIGRFVPARESVHIRSEMAQQLAPPEQTERAAAAALFAFNRMVQGDPEDTKRVRLVVAFMQAALPSLAGHPPFSVEHALTIAGWPPGASLDPVFAQQVVDEAVAQELLVAVGASGKYAVPAKALAMVEVGQKGHQHLRNRFCSSLVLRIRRSFDRVDPVVAQGVAQDIERSLVAFFRTGGFDMASTIFGAQQRYAPPLPPSLMGFLNEACTSYPDLLRRQMFSSVALEAFTDANDAERDYLGRLAEGYCAFHYLGVYGDVALERVRRAKETVWLLDSDTQIPALALAALTQPAFLACFDRLKNSGVRIFTTESLFDETWRHLQFALSVIRKRGADAPEVLAAARGTAPYSRSNQFLEGFIRWQHGGKPPDWDAYLTQAFGTATPTCELLKDVLSGFGIEVVGFDCWPGFVQILFDDRDRFTSDIVRLRSEVAGQEDKVPGEEDGDFFGVHALSKKAKPEAEALIVIDKERCGAFHMLTARGIRSPAWFVSHTGVLNRLHGDRVTWQPESFLSFVNTVVGCAKSDGEKRAQRMFETLLWAIELEGVSVLDRKSVEVAFGSQAALAVIELERERDAYDTVLGQKYGCSPVDIVKGLPIESRPTAAVQLANERAQIEKSRADTALLQVAELGKELKSVKKSYEPLEKYRKKALQRQKEGKRQKWKAASKRKR